MTVKLITGVPGTGKTLKAVSEIKKLLSEYRYIYVHGIEGLKLDHEIIVCSSATCDFCNALSDKESHRNAVDWPEYAEPGSVIVMDEVQHIYRSSGSVSVEAFETHRKKGLDFILLTQHPMFINQDLRRLVGQHIHLVSHVFGRKQYEWAECSQNLTKTSSVKSNYILDKSIYELYTSSQLHTKVDRKKPVHFYLLFIFAFITMYLLFDLTDSSFFRSMFGLPPKTAAQKAAPASSELHPLQVLRPQASVPEDDFESLPESDKWRIDTMQNYDFSLGRPVYDLKKDKRYRLVTYDGFQRYVSARHCKVIYEDLVCNLGGTLVAGWTGQPAKKDDFKTGVSEVVSMK